MDEEAKGNGIFDGAAGDGGASSSRKSAVLKHIVSFWGLTVFLLLVVAFLLTAEVVRRRRNAETALKTAEKTVSKTESSKGDGGADEAKAAVGKAVKAKSKKSDGAASSSEMDEDDELEDETAESEQKDDGESAQKTGGEAGKASIEVSASLDGYGYPNNKESLEHLDMKEDEEGITLMLPNARTIRLVRVKSGSFIIGSKDADGGRSLHEPEKKVTLTEDFWIGAHEVTRGEWKAVMECVTSIRDDKDDFPMVDVNRNDALAFCGVLNDMYGEALPSNYEFGLPTVAQWEYASRGGEDGQDTRYSGSDDIGEVAWFAENSMDAPHEVASLKPNELGLYDMSGNVAEICRDNTTGGKGGKDPCGDGHEEWQGIRGGSFDNAAFQCRVSAFEKLSRRNGRSDSVGFRVGIVPKEPEKDDAEEVADDEKSPKDDDAKKEVASASGDKSKQDADGEKAKDGETVKEGEKAKDGETAKDGEKGKDDDKGKGKEKKSRYSKPLLKTRSEESLDHKRAVTSDLKRRKLLNTRDEVIGDKDGEKDDDKEEAKEGEKTDGKDGKDGKKKRKRRSSAQLLHTRDADILKRIDEDGKENEKDGKAKRGRRSSAQLLRTRDGKDTIDIKHRKLLRTRDDKDDVEEEEPEEEADKKDGKKGKKKRHRRSSAQLLHTRDGKDTIDIKSRTLLQTREEMKAREESKKKEKEKAAEEKPKETIAEEKPKIAEETPKEVKKPEKEMVDKDEREVPVPLAKGIELLLVRVAEGEFTMGETADDKGSEVEISETFWLGKFEVTQEQFMAVMGYNPSLMTGNPRLPADNVSYDEAEDFCDALNEKFASRLPEGYEFALPSEAQWEYASRGGRKAEGGAFSGGDDSNATAWHVGNSGGRTHLPGEKDENPLGIFDMSGNVSEWCRDYCEVSESREVLSNAYGEGGRDPVGEVGCYRIRRGGAWCFSPDACRSSARAGSSEELKTNYVGFRLALVPVQEDDADEDDAGEDDDEDEDEGDE